MDSARVRVVLVTGPDREALLELGRLAVEERLAACANVVDGVTSVYRWQGAVEEAPEALAILKTSEARLAELEALIRAAHPYEVPEFLALPVSTGSPTYLAWVLDSVAP